MLHTGSRSLVMGKSLPVSKAGHVAILFNRRGRVFLRLSAPYREAFGLRKITFGFGINQL